MNINGIEIKWLGHSAIKIEAGCKIYIDPFQLQKESHDADYILITHPHYDHCSLDDLRKIVKDGTKIIMPSDCQSKILRLDNKIDMRIISLGKKMKSDDFEIHAIPAYNIGKEFHPKNQEWLGYIIKIRGKKIYHAGDTDLIPEMSNLNVDIALLPVSGKYTMNAEEAAQAAEKIKTKVAVPMHYASIVGNEGDADKFIKLCKEKAINAEKLLKE